MSDIKMMFETKQEGEKKKKLNWPALKNFFPKVSGLQSPFYAEFENTIYCVWSGQVFKMYLNTSQQVVHNNNIYSKARGLYLSQLIEGGLMFSIAYNVVCVPNYSVPLYSLTLTYLERARLIPQL